MLFTQFSAQLARLRIETLRQQQHAPQSGRAAVGADAIVKIGLDFITHAAVDRGLRQQQIIRADARARRQRAGHVECEQPAPIMRLDSHRVAYGIAAAIQFDAVAHGALGGGPGAGAAVKIQQHLTTTKVSGLPFPISSTSDALLS